MSTSANRFFSSVIADYDAERRHRRTPPVPTPPKSPAVKREDLAPAAIEKRLRLSAAARDLSSRAQVVDLAARLDDAATSINDLRRIETPPSIDAGRPPTEDDGYAAYVRKLRALIASPSDRDVDVGSFLEAQQSWARVINVGLLEIARQCYSHVGERGVLLDSLRCCVSDLVANFVSLTEYCRGVLAQLRELDVDGVVARLHHDLAERDTRLLALQQQLADSIAMQPSVSHLLARLQFHRDREMEINALLDRQATVAIAASGTRNVDGDDPLDVASDVTPSESAQTATPIPVDGLAPPLPYHPAVALTIDTSRASPMETVIDVAPNDASMLDATMACEASRNRFPRRIGTSVRIGSASNYMSPRRPYATSEAEVQASMDVGAQAHLFAPTAALVDRIAKLTEASVSVCVTVFGTRDVGKMDSTARRITEATAGLLSPSSDVSLAESAVEALRNFCTRGAEMPPPMPLSTVSSILTSATAVVEQVTMRLDALSRNAVFLRSVDLTAPRHKGEPCRLCQRTLREAVPEEYLTTLETLRCTAATLEHRLNVQSSQFAVMARRLDEERALSRRLKERAPRLIYHETHKMTSAATQTTMDATGYRLRRDTTASTATVPTAPAVPTHPSASETEESLLARVAHHLHCSLTPDQAMESIPLPQLVSTVEAVFRHKAQRDVECTTEGKPRLSFTTQLIDYFDRQRSKRVAQDLAMQLLAVPRIVTRQGVEGEETPTALAVFAQLCRSPLPPAPYSAFVGLWTCMGGSGTTKCALLVVLRAIAGLASTATSAAVDALARMAMSRSVVAATVCEVALKHRPWSEPLPQDAARRVVFVESLLLEVLTYIVGHAENFHESKEEPAPKSVSSRRRSSITV